MIFIELSMLDKINQIENLDERNEWLEMKADTECFGILNETKGKISNNYFWQDSYVFQVMKKELGKAEEKLLKKWDLENGIYVDDEDSGIASVLDDTLTDKFSVAKSMAEINNEVVLSNSKSKIVNYFNQQLEKSAENYGIEKYLIENVKKDVPTIVGEHFDKIAENLFNDKTRDKLASLCNDWEKSYEKLDYEKMNEIAQKILSNFQKPGTVYRDENLKTKLEEVITKNQFIQNKLTRGEDGKLTKIEDRVIMRYLNIGKVINEETIQSEEIDINEFTKELQQKLKEA